MIFVSVGTHEAPFDRLLHALDALTLDEPLVVQHGSSQVRPQGATCIEHLPFDTLVEHVRAARAVVTHAGVGSVMVALANGKRPLVVPRAHRFGEHVDDHQLGLARRLEQAGLVTLVEDPARLGELLATANAVAGSMEKGPWLGDDLRAYLSARIRAPADAPSAP